MSHIVRTLTTVLASVIATLTLTSFASAQTNTGQIKGVLRDHAHAGDVAVSEVVTLTTSGQILQTATGEVSEVIERKRVAELPLNGRQFKVANALGVLRYVIRVDTKRRSWNTQRPPVRVPVAN